MLTSHKELNSPPPFPLSPMVLQSRPLASFSALIALALAPPVLMPITTSLELDKASTCLLKI